MVSNYVKIFDTTLRDGEQSPGATMTSDRVESMIRGVADELAKVRQHYGE